jgi:hypothetical protein
MQTPPLHTVIEGREEMENSLIHDTATAMAQALIDTLGAHLAPEERLDLFLHFYLSCKFGIEAYEQQKELMPRLTPVSSCGEQGR